MRQIEIIFLIIRYEDKELW